MQKFSLQTENKTSYTYLSLYFPGYFYFQRCFVGSQDYLRLNIPVTMLRQHKSRGIQTIDQKRTRYVFYRHYGCACANEVTVSFVSWRLRI